MLLLLLLGGSTATAVAQVRPRPAHYHARHANVEGSSGSDALYKGFIEIGYAGGVGSCRADQLDILTTHGITFGNRLFLGVGTGVNILYPKENGTTLDWNMSGIYPGSDRYGDNKVTAVMVPVYAAVKYNFGSGSIRPFIDLKGGVAFLARTEPVRIGDGWLDDRQGVYLSPTLGVNIPTSSRAAINIGLTYSLISQQYCYYDFYYNEFFRSDGISLHSIGVKFSVEW